MDKKDFKENESTLKERLMEMEIGESISYISGPVEWFVDRVPNGWMYSNLRLDYNSMTSVFVPFYMPFDNSI